MNFGKTKYVVTVLFIFSLAGLNNCQSYSLDLKKMQRFSVGGRVEGLQHDSVIVSLIPHSRGETRQSVEIYPPGREFHFSKNVKNGSRFHINLETNPRYNSCAVRDMNEFTITKDIHDIGITCSSLPLSMIMTP